MEHLIARSADRSRYFEDVRSKLLENKQYDPNRLFDAVLKKLKIKDDTQLAGLFGVTPGAISRVRRRHNPLSYKFIALISENTGWSVKEVKMMAGICEDQL